MTGNGPWCGLFDLWSMAVALIHCLLLLHHHLWQLAWIKRRWAILVAYYLTPWGTQHGRHLARHDIFRWHLMCLSERYTPRLWWMYPGPPNSGQDIFWGSGWKSSGWTTSAWTMICSIGWWAPSDQTGEASNIHEGPHSCGSTCHNCNLVVHKHSELQDAWPAGWCCQVNGGWHSYSLWLIQLTPPTGSLRLHALATLMLSRFISIAYATGQEVWWSMLLAILRHVGVAFEYSCLSWSDLFLCYAAQYLCTAGALQRFVGGFSPSCSHTSSLRTTTGWGGVG